VHLDEAGMRRAHYALLVALREDGPASQAALGRRLAADRSDMHRTVGELESRGLIAREPDPGDRRRNLVTLTGAGVAALRGADALVDAAQAELLAPLSATERTSSSDCSPASSNGRRKQNGPPKRAVLGEERYCYVMGLSLLGR
jgi:DNA-binding MarR family transcriptional regulator